MTIQGDIEVLKRILSEPGKWLVIVHLGHIVKVAKVEPEQDARVGEGLSKADFSLC